MTERLLIVRTGDWPRTRRAWPLQSSRWDGPFAGRKSAGAAFSRVDGAWRCVRAVPPLMSWLDMPMEDIKSLLEDRSLSYTWARRFDL